MKNESQEIIGFYEKEFYFLSNFSSFAVEWRDQLWMTAEHAYQAAKFDDPTIREKIRNARSAYDSKNIARAHDKFKRENWADIKLKVMEEILRAKLAQHPYIKEKLFETGSKLLVEDSFRDAYWGWGLNKDGENHLGKLWMKIRAVKSTE